MRLGEEAAWLLPLLVSLQRGTMFLHQELLQSLYHPTIEDHKAVIDRGTPKRRSRDRLNAEHLVSVVAITGSKPYAIGRVRVWPFQKSMDLLSQNPGACVCSCAQPACKEYPAKTATDRRRAPSHRLLVWDPSNLMRSQSRNIVPGNRIRYWPKLEQLVPSNNFMNNRSQRLLDAP